MRQLFVALVLALLSLPVQAQVSSTRLLLNEQALNLPVSPFVQDATLYLPIQVVEQLGFALHLDPVRHSARLIKPGTFYQLREGSRQITWQGQGLQISHAPLWQQGTLYVPRSLFASLGVVLTYSLQGDEVRLSADLNRLNQVQVLPGNVYTRVVIEFAKEPAYRLNETANTISLDLMGVETEGIESLVPEVQDLLLKGLKIEKTGTASARLRIDKAYASPHKLYWLKDPHRLVVDLVKIFQEDKQSTVGKGIELTRSYQGFAFGPVTYYCVRIHPQAGVHIEPVLAGTRRGFVKETVSQIAQRKQALVGINGGYFNNAGVPLGMLLLNRELISSPFYGRTMLGFLPQDKLVITPGDRSASVFFPQLNRTMAFHGVNLPRQNNQAILYTPRFGLTTATTSSPDAIELQLAIDGTVMGLFSHDAPIPEDGYVISIHGQSAPWLKQQAYEGMRALVFLKIWEQWPQAQNLLGGGPQLLKNGQIYLTTEQEKFQPDIAQGRAPRTALGLTQNGDILLLVVDGRQSHSRGLTLPELAQLMKEKGAVEAMNFDGGGSSALVVNHKLLNSPSDGHERPVATALLVMPNKP